MLSCFAVVTSLYTVSTASHSNSDTATGVYAFVIYISWLLSAGLTLSARLLGDETERRETKNNIATAKRKSLCFDVTVICPALVLSGH